MKKLEAGFMRRHAFDVKIKRELLKATWENTLFVARSEKNLDLF